MKNNQNLLQEIDGGRLQLLSKTGIGVERTGRLNYPNTISDDTIADIIDTANRLNAISDYIIVIGIGGSYIGSKAVIDACLGVGPLPKHKILYAGHHMDSDYHSSLLQICDNYDYSVIVISKSGTTLEPKLAFDQILDHMKEKYGNDHNNRVVCITDKQSGLLRSIADQCGYKSYSIPSDVGGRYSVATPVGLLPMACAGLDIKQFIAGMSEVYTTFIRGSYDEISEYVQWRIGNYRDGKSIECMANFSPRHSSLTLWWQQLFGESEGKQGQGLFPAVLQYSTDLHSMGQYMQDGVRLMIETLLFIDIGNNEMEKANDACRRGTVESHQSGGVPLYEWNIGMNTEYAVGKRMFQMMLACAISCYLAEVNPFDQPGVEGYKQAMKKFLNNEG